MSIAASRSVRAALRSAPTETSSEQFSIKEPESPEAEFSRQLERIGAWKRRNLRILDMPQGAEVLVWLLRSGARSRPLKDLYRGSRFSEPTIRWVLKALVDGRFIVIERSPDDLRVRTVHLTPKLMATVHEYLALLRNCAVQAEQPVDSEQVRYAAD